MLTNEKVEGELAERKTRDSRGAVENGIRERI